MSRLGLTRIYLLCRAKLSVSVNTAPTSKFRGFPHKKAKNGNLGKIFNENINFHFSAKKSEQKVSNENFPIYFCTKKTPKYSPFGKIDLKDLLEKSYNQIGVKILKV